MIDDEPPAEPQAQSEGQNNPAPPREAADSTLTRLNKPEREKAKWTDIATVLLTLVISAFAGGSFWIFEGQLREMHDATLLGQRAWIQVTENRFDWRPGAPIVWPLHIKDIGKTIARKVDGRVAIQYLQKGEEPTFDYTPNTGHPYTQFVSGIMYPATGEDFSVPLFIPAPPGVRPAQVMSVTPDRYSEIMKGAAYIAIHGRITYEDIFGGHHWMTFCVLTTPTTIQWEALSKTCMEYNKTDDTR